MSGSLFCDQCAGTGVITRKNMHGFDVDMACPKCQVPMKDPSVDKMPGVRKDARQTSVDAAYSHYPKSGSTRLAVLSVYTEVYPEGLTHEELSERMGNIGTSTYRARASELEKGGWLKDSGKRRKTRQGDESVVWELTDYGARRQGVWHRLAKGRPYAD